MCGWGAEGLDKGDGEDRAEDRPARGEKRRQRSGMSHQSVPRPWKGAGHPRRRSHSGWQFGGVCVVS